jgi:hypothetical protein
MIWAVMSNFSWLLTLSLNFSIATMRSEIAAGVTPAIRDACPIVAGLTRDSFSITSRENP